MKILECTDRTPALLAQLLDVWERSVRATHTFLSEPEILRIRQYVPEALGGVAHLFAALDEDGRPLGFMGVQDGSLEMLFLTEPRRPRLLRAHGLCRLQAHRHRRAGRALSPALYAQGGLTMKLTSSVLYVIAGILFFAAAWTGSGPAFYAIGTCFFALGAVEWKRDK